MNKEDIIELNPNMMFMDGFDDAIVGVCYQYGRPPVVAYSLRKVITKLMEDGMTEEEALEYWEFNQLGAYMGENTPVFIEQEDEVKS